MIILDTNVVSELMRPEPDPAVMARFANLTDQDVRTTVITLAEITYGLERMPTGRRREALLLAYAEIFAGFTGRILDFDRAAALHYGALVAACERAGRRIATMDAQIAGIALARRAHLATRNEKDFQDSGVTIVNPWT